MKAKKLGSRSDTQLSHALSRYVNGSGTDPGPLAQPPGIAKCGHINANFDQEFRRGQPINAGHGHQQLQGRLMGLERLHQIAFEVGQLCV